MMDKEKEKCKLDWMAEEYHKPHMVGVDRKHNEAQSGYVSGFCKGEILELGVGDTAWLECMVKKFAVIDIVDASEKLLQECEQIYGVRVNTFLSLFEEFKPEKKYDTINMGHILEHVYDPVKVLCLAEGWLKDGGVINIVVPHADSIHRRLGVLMGLSNFTTDLHYFDKKIGHRRVYTIETLRKHVQEAGLRVVVEQGLFLKVVNNAKMENWSDSMIKGLFEIGFQIPIEFSASLFFQCERIE